MAVPFPFRRSQGTPGSGVVQPVLHYHHNKHDTDSAYLCWGDFCAQASSQPQFHDEDEEEA